MRIAIATFASLPPEFTDDERLADSIAALGAEVARVPWDEADADWDSFDAVVIRSTWDYAPRRDEFVEWADSVGTRLHNSPEMIRWNTDKRYMGDLEARGPARGAHGVSGAGRAGACPRRRGGCETDDLGGRKGLGALQRADA